MGKHFGKRILEKERNKWEEIIMNIMRETGNRMEGSCAMLPVSGNYNVISICDVMFTKRCSID
jgi:hypothetical protein